MAATSVALRCSHCGQWLVAPSTGAATRWVPCPHCGSLLPVLGPRDPPPLFGWEVYPHLYPALPPTRVPSPRWATLAAILLLASAALLVGLGGFLLAAGVQSLSPGSTPVGGTVVSATTPAHPIAGARVALVDERGAVRTTLTGLDGRFSFGHVPHGGVTLNISAIGYVTTVFRLFVSPVYSSPSPNSADLAYPLQPGNASITSVVATGPFPDLESFVATLWSASGILSVGAVAATAGGWTSWRRRRPAVGVAAGTGVALVPLALVLLGVPTAFPDALWLGGAVAAFGVVAVILRMAPMALLGDEEATGALP